MSNLFWLNDAQWRVWDPADERRNRIEGGFSKLKHYRAIATRYKKHDTDVLALAATRIRLRAYETVTHSV